MHIPTDANGRNTFHVAANGVPRTVSKLLNINKKSQNAALTARDNAGNLPVHIAAKLGHLRIVKILLEACPESANLRDTNGMTVFDILRHRDAPIDFQIRTKLVSWGTNMDCLGRIEENDPWLSPGYVTYPFRLTGSSSFAELYTPQQICDLAVSAGAAICIAKPINSFDRQIFICGSKLGARSPRFQLLEFPRTYAGQLRAVSCSDSHAVVVSDSCCWTWGQNNYGQLGQDIDEKALPTPTKVDDFLQFRLDSKKNAFGALSSRDMDREPVEKLVGCSCASSFTAVYTGTKVWAWGFNYGQMMGRAASGIVETATMVLDSSRLSCRIVKVVCLDKAIAVLLSNGSTLLLTDNTSANVPIRGKTVDIQARGNYMVAQTETGRLLHFVLPPKAKAFQEPTKIWSCKRAQIDSVRSFDLAETGSVVFSTNNSVYTCTRGEAAEVANTQGLDIKIVRCDAKFKEFMGAQEFYMSPEVMVETRSLVNDIRELSPYELADTSAAFGRSPFSYFESSSDLEPKVVDSFNWDVISYPSDESADSWFSVEGSRFPVHGDVLIARCPRLAPLRQNQQFVATRGGCEITYDKSTRTFSIENICKEAVIAFLTFVYSGQPVNSPPNSIGKQYRDLQLLVEGTLPQGFLRMLDMGGDVKIKLADTSMKAHSYILRARSEYFDTRLGSRWSGSNEVDMTQFDSEAFRIVLRFLYSGQSRDSLISLQGSEFEVLNTLIEVWTIANKLLLSQLEQVIEGVLLEFVNLETCLEMLTVVQNTRLLHRAARELTARHMDYFIRDFSSASGGLIDILETTYKSLNHPDKPDTENIEDLLKKLTITSTPSSAFISAPSSSSSSVASSVRSSPEPKPEPKPVGVSQAPAVSGRGTKITLKAPTPAITPERKPSPLENRSPINPWSRPSSSPQSVPSASPRSLPKLGALGASGDNPGKPRPRTPSVPKQRLSQKERRKLQQEIESREATPVPTSSTPINTPAAPWVRKPSHSSSSSLLREHIQKMNQERQQKSKKINS